VSAEDDAAAVLDQVIPLGDDHPAAQQLAEAIANHVANRPPRQLFGEALLEATATDASGIARAGDVLVLGSRSPITPAQAQEAREQIQARLPGLADVVIVPFELVAIYRGDAP